MAEDKSPFWDVVEAPGEALVGGIAAIIRGQSPVKGAVRAVKTDATFRAIQEALHAEGVVKRYTPVLGPEGPGSTVTNVIGTILLDPLNVVGAGGIAGKSTKLGRYTQHLEGAMKALQESGQIPKVATPARFAKMRLPLTIREAAEPTRGLDLAARDVRAVERGKLARQARGKPFSPELGATPGEQIRLGQRRFFGMTGEGPARVQEAIGKAISGTAKAAVEAPLIGGPVRAIRDIFGLGMDPLDRGIRRMRAARNSVYHNEFITGIDEGIKQARVEKRMSDEQLAQAHEIFRNMYRLKEPHTIRVPRGTKRVKVGIEPMDIMEGVAVQEKRPWQMTREEFRDLRPEVEGFVYHGSPEGDIVAVDPWYSTGSWREGIGFYTTESREVAERYAKGQTAKGERKAGAAGKGRVNYVRLDPDAKILDMEAPADMQVWGPLFEKAGVRFDPSIPGKPFAQGTNGAAFQDLVIQIQRDARVGADEVAGEIREALEDLGFAGTTHIEGRQATPHRVRVLFGTESVDKAGKVSSTAKYKIVPPDEVYDELIAKMGGQGRARGGPRDAGGIADDIARDVGADISGQIRPLVDAIMAGKSRPEIEAILKGLKRDRSFIGAMGVAGADETMSETDIVSGVFERIAKEIKAEKELRAAGAAGGESPGAAAFTERAALPPPTELVPQFDEYHLPKGALIQADVRQLDQSSADILDEILRRSQIDPSDPALLAEEAADEARRQGIREARRRGQPVSGPDEPSLVSGRLLRVREARQLGRQKTLPGNFQIPFNKIDTDTWIDFDHPAFRNYLDTVQNQFAGVRQMDRATGLLRAAVPGYFPTIVAPEFMKLLEGKWLQFASNNPNAGRLYSAFLRFKNKATLREFSIADLNEAIDALGGRSLMDELFTDGSFMKRLMRADPDGFAALVEKRGGPFVTQPSKALFIRKMASARARTNQAFLQNALNAFGKRVRLNVNGRYVEVPSISTRNMRLIKSLLQENPDHVYVVPSKVFKGLFPFDDPALGKKVFDSGVLEMTPEIADRLNKASTQLGRRAPRGYFVPRKAYEEMTKTYEVLRSGEKIAPWLQAFDQGLNWWKAWTLLALPAYHTRNAISNMWLLWLGGVRNPAVFGRAMQLMLTHATEGNDRRNALARAASAAFPGGLGAKGSLDEVLIPGRYGETVMTGRQFLGEVRDQGLLNNGFNADIPTMLEDEARILDRMQPGVAPKARRVLESLTGATATGRRRNLILRAGDRAASAIENWSRIAAYMHARIERGLGPSEAGDFVRKYLFDYADVTPLDRVIKRIVPFWMWQKHNLPLMIEGVVKQPEQFLAILKAKKAIESGVGPDSDRARSDWIKKLYGVSIRRDPKTGEVEYFFLRNWWPAADLAELSDPLKSVIESVNPWIKSPVEVAFNRNIFFDRDIEKYPGEPGRIGTPLGTMELGDLFGMSGKKWEHLIRNALPSRLYREGIEKALGFDPRGFKTGGVIPLGQALGLTTAKSDPQKVVEGRKREMSEWRSSANRDYRRRLELGDIGGAKKLMERWEKKAKQLEKDLR